MNWSFHISNDFYERDILFQLPYQNIHQIKTLIVLKYRIRLLTNPKNNGFLSFSLPSNT